MRLLHLLVVCHLLQWSFDLWLVVFSSAVIHVGILRDFFLMEHKGLFSMCLLPILFIRNNFPWGVWVVLILGPSSNGKILLMHKDHSDHWRKVQYFIYFGWNSAIQFHVEETKSVSAAFIYVCKRTFWW